MSMHSQKGPFNPSRVISRTEVIQHLSDSSAPAFELVVVGGGIHGAACARIAAQSGMRVALLEQADYASGTSCRSSKMAHGGLRYLELFDFQQVFEGIKAREELFDNVGHLVSPSEFLIPIPKNDYFLRIKLGIGLTLYDLLVRNKKRRHHWKSREALHYQGFDAQRTDLMGCYVYTDGIMSDARLTLENIALARRAGACCLNYARVVSLERSAHGEHALHVRESISQKEILVRAKLILNCAGPWASTLAKTLEAAPGAMKFSRGSHILFNKPWNAPSLFLPMEGKARYYFVWPHPAGTMVGTTEREVTELSDDPLPTSDEIQEILQRLEKDLPDAGLNRDSAHYCFAGIRSLPLRNSNAASSVLSRKHQWLYKDNVLTLLGGKYTTANWTAREGVTQAAKFLKISIPKKIQTDLSQFAGSCSADEAQLLVKELRKQGLSEATARQQVRRFGSTSLENLSFSGNILQEVQYALDYEQAETLEDVMRRRLELEYEYQHGTAHLSSMESLFHEKKPLLDFKQEVLKYEKRMTEIQKLIKNR